jgi:hypothetical protein
LPVQPELCKRRFRPGKRTNSSLSPAHPEAKELEDRVWAEVAAAKAVDPTKEAGAWVEVPEAVVRLKEDKASEVVLKEKVRDKVAEVEVGEADE